MGAHGSVHRSDCRLQPCNTISRQHFECQEYQVFTEQTYPTKPTTRNIYVTSKEMVQMANESFVENDEYKYIQLSVDVHNGASLAVRSTNTTRASCFATLEEAFTSTSWSWETRSTRHACGGGYKAQWRALCKTVTTILPYERNCGKSENVRSP